MEGIDLVVVLMKGMCRCVARKKERERDGDYCGIGSLVYFIPTSLLMDVCD